MFSEKTNSVFDFITKHIILLSGVVISTGLFITYVYMIAYLSPFDIHLIDYIEYPDYAKLGLKFSFVIVPVIFGCYSIYVQNNGGSELSLRSTAAFFILETSSALLVFFLLRSMHKHEFHQVELEATVSAVSYVLPTYMVGTFLILRRYIRSKIIFLTTFHLIGFSLVCLFGIKSGVDVRFDKGNLYNVTLKKPAQNSLVLENVTLIMTLSHHSMFFKDGRSIVVQSPDIERLERVTQGEGKPVP